MKVASHPEDLARVLNDPAWRLERVGLEAGPLSQWLFEGLVRAGLPVICIETRHTKAFLKAQVNVERSEWSVSQDLQTGRLIRVLPDWSLPDADIVALLNPRAVRAVRVDSFVDRLAAEIMSGA